MSDKQVIGTCGNCGGPVEQYLYLFIVGPFPPATCRNCGAQEAKPYGPTIPMKPRSTVTRGDIGNDLDIEFS